MVTESQTPSCSEHGMMVPVRRRFCYAPFDYVEAIVLWDKRDGIMVDEVYAPNQLRTSLPTLGPGLGEEIDDLLKSGQLFEFADLMHELTGLYRISDRRPDSPGSDYMVWTGCCLSPVIATMHPNTVYRFYRGGGDDCAVPRSLGDIFSMMELPDAMFVDDVRGAGDNIGSETFRQVVGEVRGRVTVFDLGEIERKLVDDD